METLKDSPGKYVLGIDAGGTYTDLVALEGGTGTILAWSKNLTTYGDLAVGISRGFKELLKTVSVDGVSSVNLATTLATNAIVEGKARPAGLLMIGYDRLFLEQNSLTGKLGTDRVAFIAGGHDLHGDERESLDEEMVRKVVKAMESEVESFAISGFFSVRNPEHELRVREIIREVTGLPVSCGHELATELDAIKRATTAVLNAGLIPILVRLLDAVEREMDRFGLHVPLMVVRGDGSLVSADWARSHPVETVLSGPAASAVGAGFLAGGFPREGVTDDLWVVDMGGTTTDIVRLDQKKEPRLSSSGAMVGGYRTLVEAIDIHTLGLGGDSRVQFPDREEILIGPRRIIPLCLAAKEHPSLIGLLEKALLQEDPGRDFGVLLPGICDHSDDSFEKGVLQALKGGPVLLQKVLQTERLRNQTLRRLQVMEQRGGLVWCGFTPTDALHVLGKMDHWEGKASRLGAALMAGQGQEEVFSRRVCREVSRSVSREVAGKSLFDQGVALNGENEVLFGMAFRDNQIEGPRFLFDLDGGVVGIGAPSAAFLPAAESWLGSTVQVPKGAHVAVALGAAVSSVRYRYGVRLTPVPGGGIRVHSPKGVRHFEELEPAVEWAESEIYPWVLEQARFAGARNCRVTCRREDMEARISGGSATVYLGTCLWFQAEEGAPVAERA